MEKDQRSSEIADRDALQHAENTHRAEVVRDDVVSGEIEADDPRDARRDESARDLVISQEQKERCGGEQQPDDQLKNVGRGGGGELEEREDRDRKAEEENC